MVVGPGITGPPCQTRGGEAPSGLVGSHIGPEMACALTMPLNRPIFAGSRDAQAPAFVVPAAAEPVVVSRPAASMPKASSTINFLISPPLLDNAEDEVSLDSQGGQPGTLAASGPITVDVDRASSTWEPATAVVYVGRTSGECAGPSASVCCRYINFFG